VDYGRHPDVSLRMQDWTSTSFGQEKLYYGRTLSDASMLYFADVFSSFFMAALVGQTAERIFTKLSHVVYIRSSLRTY